MKKIYLFIVLFPLCWSSYSQDDDNVYSDLNYAYSDVKDSYEANNVSHLKYYANKSLEALKRAKPKLKTHHCEKAYNNVAEGIDLLEKVEFSETFEDGRFYVKRARENAKQSIIEFDKCNANTTDGDEISALKNEQERLAQMQEELKKKAADLQAKMAAEKEKELSLKKEILISNYKSVIASNIKTYNDFLNLCECAQEPITAVAVDDESLKAKRIDEIKLYFINNMKALTSNYVSQLNLCEKSQ